MGSILKACFLVLVCSYLTPPPHPGSSADLPGMVVVGNWGPTRAWRWCVGCAGGTQLPPLPQTCPVSDPYPSPRVAVCCARPSLWVWAAWASREEGPGTVPGVGEGTVEPVRGLSGGFLG